MFFHTLISWYMQIQPSILVLSPKEEHTGDNVASG